MRNPSCQRVQHPGDVMLSDIDLDSYDYSALTAARFFFSAFASPQSDPWLSMVIGSDHLFPGVQSAETMRRLLTVVHEMRLARKSVMRFSNPTCPCCAEILTEEERHLVQTLQAVRDGRKSRAASSAMLLCEGHDTAEFLSAVARFCAHMPARIKSAGMVTFP